MSEFTTQNGAKVVIACAAFGAAMELKAAIQYEISTSNFQLEIPAGIESKGLEDIDLDVMSIIRLAFKIDAAPTVLAATFKCLEKCSYNGEQIKEITFENEKARGDWYEILGACWLKNLGPLVQGAPRFLKFFGVGQLVKLFIQK